MLKGIPTNLSPELFKVLMEMGHGDEIVLADGNFPAQSLAQRIIRADGHNIPSLLDSILSFFPLDTFVKAPVTLMETVDPSESQPPIWEEYYKLIANNSDHPFEVNHIERYDFYKQSKHAYAIVATGEMALYGNIILKKGVIDSG